MPDRSDTLTWWEKAPRTAEEDCINDPIYQTLESSFKLALNPFEALLNLTTPEEAETIINVINDPWSA
jgi:hypothetical protein